ncbi:PIN domain-containing protein [Haloarchaeobius sp. TZWWS8]|uniref:PIN domain-containing protein n=1 Tax=Haloarchaeobius sp. TZWWS8 TaxID=3446121 RepID=UPI003EBC47C6
MTARVALDTNALMMPVELDVRLFDELDRLLGTFESVSPQAVVEELRRLADKGGQEGTAATVGHDLATERCLIVDTEESYADDAIVELAQEGQVDYVVTNDLPLRDRVLGAGVPVIALRGRNKLAITQP